MKTLSKINIACVSLMIIFSLAQLTSTGQDADDSEKQKAYMSLNYVNDKGEGRVFFKVFKRENRKRIPVEFVVVNLYLNENSKLGMLGNITTDENGEGSVLLANKFAMLSDTLSEFTFIGSLMNDLRLKDKVTELTIKPARMSVELVEEDSVRYVNVLAETKNDSGEWVPAEEAEINFYVKRYFSLLPISEYPVYTEEDGKAQLEFPEGIKGDSLGNVTVVAKINEHEDFGTHIVSDEIPWGVPVNVESQEERLLSSSRKNAPLALVIVSNAIILGVWGLIFFIIFQLYKIKSLSKPKTES